MRPVSGGGKGRGKGKLLSLAVMFWKKPITSQGGNISEDKKGARDEAWL